MNNMPTFFFTLILQGPAVAQCAYFGHGFVSGEASCPRPSCWCVSSIVAGESNNGSARRVGRWHMLADGCLPLSRESPGTVSCGMAAADNPPLS